MKRTLGPWVVDWMERNLPHGPGDIMGEPLVLDAEEVYLIFKAYEVDDRGRRLIRRAVYSRPKGRRKSEIGGGLCCAEALGPVRFSGFDRRGYPMARAVRSPFVRINATEEGQGGNTYDNVFTMLTHGPLANLPGLDVGLTRVFTPDHGEIRVSTAAAASKDGGKETFSLFDETHLYISPELHQLSKTVRRNLAKRKIAEPWAFDTTTMFEPGMMSVAELAWLHYQKILAGKIIDPGFLYDHREAPPVQDFDDDDELLAALTYAYGEAASWVDFERMIAELRDPETKRHEWQRYFLNQGTREKDLSLVDLSVWDERAVDVSPRQLLPEARRVCLGIDGSRAHDQAVIAWAQPPTAAGEVTFDVQVHTVRRDQLPDISPHVLHNGRIDYDDFSDSVTEKFVTYKVLEAAFGTDYVDKATTVVERRLPSARIAPVPRLSKLERAAFSALDRVLVERRYRHRGDPVLRRQIANALVERDPETKAIIRIRRRNESEPLHAVYALAFAVWRATRPLVGNPYQDRDLRVIGEGSPGGSDVSPDEIRDRYAERLYDDGDDPIETEE